MKIKPQFHLFPISMAAVSGQSYYCGSVWEENNLFNPLTVCKQATLG